MKKKPIKYVLKRWEIDDLLARMDELEKKMKYVAERSVLTNEIQIYSSATHICIGMQHKDWHRIVCQYDGDRCIGGPNPHWTTKWMMKSNGFSLESMVDEHWKGWKGQYNPDNELKYDQLPKDTLQRHHNALMEHIKQLAIWYPCALYDDINGVLHRP